MIEDIKESEVEVTNLLRIIGGVSDIPIVTRGPTGMVRCAELNKDKQLTAPSSEKDERFPVSKGNRGAKNGTLTLQDASILWSVTQTAMTLSTGDHSFPSIDAHILGRIQLETSGSA